MTLSATAVPPTAPAGLAAAVASVAGFIALWGTVVLAFYHYVTSLFDQQVDLTNQLNNNQAFPGPVPAEYCVRAGRRGFRVAATILVRCPPRLACPSSLMAAR
ncbi:hypothetical protein [Actinoplanes sp. NPDC026623]|uniref:hypothetical protein n=1 Tax=Actinoplanes sp. NPDC026623 TaxID=3155610 RepID=UPI003407DFB3